MSSTKRRPMNFSAPPATSPTMSPIISPLASFHAQLVFVWVLNNTLGDDRATAIGSEPPALVETAQTVARLLHELLRIQIEATSPEHILQPLLFFDPANHSHDRFILLAV